jgi:hypothetical protein
MEHDYNRPPTNCGYRTRFHVTPPFPFHWLVWTVPYLVPYLVRPVRARLMWSARVAESMSQTVASHALGQLSHSNVFDYIWKKTPFQPLFLFDCTSRARPETQLPSTTTLRSCLIWAWPTVSNQCHFHKRGNITNYKELHTWQFCNTTNVIIISLRLIRS